MPDLEDSKGNCIMTTNEIYYIEYRTKKNDPFAIWKPTFTSFDAAQKQRDILIARGVDSAVIKKGPIPKKSV